VSERIKQHKERLAAARQRLDDVFNQVGDRWQAQVYSEGAAWNIHQLAIHLMVSDKGQNNTVMKIAEGENTIPEDFDLERFNRRSVEKRAEATPEEIRSALAASRTELLVWLDTIDDSALEKEGRHASLRILTVGQILDVMANHERNHASDIAGVLGIN
jgi:hypothetical protein